MVNNIVLVIKSPPYGSGRAAEGIRMATALIAMDVLPQLLFMNDGIYCLLKNQMLEIAGATSLKDRLQTIADLLGINEMSDSMAKQNIRINDFEESYNAKLVSLDETIEIMFESDTVITF
jgi:sulfur relay (sulfurtransferase) DsrF/TusC family protein